MDDNNLNIVLVGMPGAGKSYIGDRLARLLVHFKYVDIDEEIEKKEGMSIEEIFSFKSEEYFRKIESEIIEDFSKQKNLIIALGGGAAQNQKNIDNLKQNGLIYYLKASPNEIYGRIKNETHRPLLKNGLSVETLNATLKQREKQYKKAHFTINTDKKAGYTILDEIINEYDDYAKKACC